MTSKRIVLISSILIVGILYVLLIKPVNWIEKKSDIYLEKNSKATTLKKYLLAQPKPQRIEVFNYTKKFENDVNLLKKLKIPQDKGSGVYMTIQFFTDEDDPKAPLIAQIRILDAKTQNLKQEESLNLE